MARYNIKLNYEELKKLSESCLNLAVSLGDIETAIKNMDDAVGNCSGKAAEALYGKGAEIVSNMGDLGIGLTKFSVNIANYSNDMKAIIDAAGSGMLHINTVDVSWNLRQMISDLLEFDSFARGVNPKGNVNALSLGASPNYDSDEDKMLMNQLSGKLDNIKELLVAAANDLANYDEDFEKFKNIISEFENKDDEYRDILQEVYYEISDTGFWGKTSTKVIIGVTLIVVAAAIVFLAPILAGVGGVVGACAAAIAGCAWLTAIATEVIAVGLFTGVFAGGLAVFTGSDIEDAVGGGLIEGNVYIMDIDDEEMISDITYVRRSLDNEYTQMCNMYIHEFPRYIKITAKNYDMSMKYFADNILQCYNGEKNTEYITHVLYGERHSSTPNPGFLYVYFTTDDYVVLINRTGVPAKYIKMTKEEYAEYEYMDRFGILDKSNDVIIDGEINPELLKELEK